jgi:hypothetical protein
MAKAARRKSRKVKKSGKRARITAAKRGPRGAVLDLSAYRNHLVAERDDIDKKIAALETAMSVMGTAAPSGRRPARRTGAGFAGAVGRRGSLKTYVAKVLMSGGGTMAVKDVTSRVLRAGYKTRNKTLAKSVGIALKQMPNVRKVGRGRFRLK